jgi:P-type Mg2+ transporter
MDGFSKQPLVRLTVLLVLFMLLVNLLFTRRLLESFLFALARAVKLSGYKLLSR